MIKKLLIIIIIILAISSGWNKPVYAQEIPIYYQSQYLNNPYLINPAIAGSRDYTILNLSVRQNTAKIDGAPKTQMLSAQTRLRNFIDLKSKSIKKGSQFSNVGLGGYLFNDASGPLKKIGFQFTYAYHLPLSRKSIEHLSFGVSFNGFTYSINYGELNVLRDPLINEGTQRAFVPDANFGVFYYGKYLFGGISVAQIFETPIKWSNENFEQVPIARRYFLFAGTKFLIMDNILIEPSVLFRAQDETISTIYKQFDINLKVYYNTILGGLSYRMNEGFTIWGQYQYRNFFFGLAYEYPTSEIVSYSYGTIEVVLGINLGQGRNRFGDSRYW